MPSDDDLLLVETMAPSPAHTPQHPQPTPSHNSASSPSKPKQSQSPALSPTGSNSSAQSRPRSRASLQGGRLTSGQINKLSRDIQITQTHLDVFGELLSELVPGEEHPDDLDMLVQVATTTKEMQDRVTELVRMVEHREITMALLEINDRIISEMVRFERYQNKRRNKEQEAAIAQNDEVTSSFQ